VLLPRAWLDAMPLHRDYDGRMPCEHATLSITST
jgi:hypothetical protein